MVTDRDEMQFNEKNHEKDSDNIRVHFILPNFRCNIICHLPARLLPGQPI